MALPVADNIETTIETWIGLYNSDPHRMIDECYAKDAKVSIPGVLEFADMEHFHKAEDALLKAFPDRRVNLVRSHVFGDGVAIECTFTYGQADGTDARVSYFCDILKFRDGRIISDHIYGAIQPPGVTAEV